MSTGTTASSSSTSSSTTLSVSSSLSSLLSTDSSISITSVSSAAPTTSSSPPSDDGGIPGGESPNSRLTRRPINEIAVYTFLATLVLLLSVSAAIVIRSFVLRRRHRRMIEEAIRNGTWIPPAPGGRAGPRVDLSKKPKLWETYLDLNQEDTFQHNTMLEERDWESIKPVMAGYIKDPSANGSSNGTASVNASNGNERDENNEGRTTRQFPLDLGGGWTRRMRNILQRPASTLPVTHPVSNGNSRHGSTVDVGNQDMPMSELTPEPQRVRVAVLVAMPRPHHSHSSSSSSSAQPSNSLSSDEEERLPHLEMGVAEIVLVSESRLLHLNPITNHGGKGKLRESMASSGSV